MGAVKGHGDRAVHGRGQGPTRYSTLCKGSEQRCLDTVKGAVTGQGTTVPGSASAPLMAGPCATRGDHCLLQVLKYAVLCCALCAGCSSCVLHKQREATPEQVHWMRPAIDERHRDFGRIHRRRRPRRPRHIPCRRLQGVRLPL